MVLMTALLLHIGSPKAGSSAIQASLEQCSKQLRRSSGVLVLPSNPSCPWTCSPAFWPTC